jgi:hypothetical protein
MELKFFNDDFNRLKRIGEINDKLFTPAKGYSSSLYKNEVKTLQKTVLQKMKKLKNLLSEEPYFYKRFDIDISRTNKQSNQYSQGYIRKSAWISLADRRELIKLKELKYKHMLIPQMQVSLQPDKLLVASIWLEGKACKQIYRDKFFNYLDKEGTGKRYKTVIIEKVSHAKVFEGNYNKLTAKEKKLYREKSNYSLGIQRELTKNEVINADENICSLIIEELQILNEKIFSPCFNYRINGQLNDGLSKSKSHRKSRSKYEILSAFRKGNENREVIYKHRQIQNDLFDYFINRYKNSGIVTKLEEDFADIKVESPDKKLLILYEIKTDKSAIKCIKNGLGQLIFYNLINKEYGWKNIELVIVGLHRMNVEAKKFVNNIKEFLGKDNFRYQVFNNSKKYLLPESKS